MKDNVIDINTKKPVRPDIPEDATVSQWLNAWKKYIKDNGAKTVGVVGVDAEGSFFYDILGVSEIDLLRIYREADNLKLLIDSKLDPEYEVEYEE